METIAEKNQFSVETPKNRCADSVFMELGLQSSQSNLDKHHFAINSILTFTKANIDIGRLFHRVAFGITHGTLNLNLKGCHAIPDSYINFSHNTANQSEKGNADPNIDDVLKHDKDPSQSKKLEGLLEKVGISNVKKKDRDEIFQQFEEDYIQINESDMSAKGTLTEPLWEFRASVHNDEVFLDRSFTCDNLVQIEINEEPASIEATFAVPLHAIHIIDSDFLPSDIGAVKQSIIKSVLRKYIWSKYFQPYVSIQSIAIKV